MNVVRGSLLFLILIAAAVGTFWLGRPAPEPEITNVREPDGADYYLLRAVILGTNAAGEVSYRIHAGRLEQTTHENRSMLLTDVRVEYDETEQIPWLVTAPRATADGNGESLRLSGGVRLTTAPADGTVAIVIETPELTFEPDAYFASGAEPVSYSRGKNRLTAASFTADLRKDLIDLSDVYAELHP